MASPVIADVGTVIAGRHRDPHQVLGFHDGRVIAYRPAACAMQVILPSGVQVEMRLLHEAGVYVTEAPEAESGYRLRAEYPQGDAHEFVDPYRFGPTVGDQDLHFFGEGRHRNLWKVLGANVRTHEGEAGTSFAVWAPAARAVSVVGDFNSWDGRLHPMRSLGSSGIWEIFLPDVGGGALYKFEILTQDGHLRMKADPFAFETQPPPSTDSVVHFSRHRWADRAWIERRREVEPHGKPMSIYELHLGSWRLNTLEDNRSLTYAELADELAAYVNDLGFTHVELMPVMEHPYAGSWGYQVSGYFAPTARHGTPDEFRALVDSLHGQGIGVIVDWVPAHFPRDDWALARFDGSALYEHADPRCGSHPEWGTLIFNYGRQEVR
ncbi:MAG: alpha-amylase family glycosyl hydrolase, partial [Acidimicrobiales bacterium]